MQARKLLVVVLTLVVATISRSAGADEPRKPNVVLILCDDTGYSDIAVQGGNGTPTPNIDSIAQTGVRCTNGYVSCPYCSPTRAGIMTGRYQERFGHEFNEGAGRLPFGLPLSETTFAQRMKDLGYATAVIGKWHLGNLPQFRPMQRGFDEFYGTLANTAFFHPNLVDSRINPDPQPVKDDAFYTTDAYAERAVDFIDKHADAPFFLYLPFNACHTPLEAPAKYLERFPQFHNPQRQAYAAILSALDDAVGRVLTALREKNLEENTLIIFLSDNGATGTPGSSNKPLRGNKMSMWEGGIRIPFFIQWKGKIPAGEVYDKPVIALDLLPTALAAAGGEINPDWKLDGVDLLPYLTKKTDDAPHKELFWRLGAQWAVRSGDWKLVTPVDHALKKEAPGPASFRVQPQPFLFDLAKDPGEEHDLSAENPDKVKELLAAWDNWNRQLAVPGWLQ